MRLRQYLGLGALVSLLAVLFALSADAQQGCRTNVNNTTNCTGSFTFSGNVSAVNVVASGDVIVTDDISGDAITARDIALAGGTLTDSNPGFTLSQTWNDGSEAFSAFTVTATNTASAATSKLLDLILGPSTSLFSVDRSGVSLAQAANVSNTLYYGWTGRSRIYSTADGVVQLFNNAGNGFTRLVLGTNDTSGTAFTKSTTITSSTLGDGTAGGSFRASGTFGFSTLEPVTVNGATTFAVTSSYVVLACTGAESIDTITGGFAGMRLVIEHTDTECTLKDDDTATAANAIDLAGTATDDVGALAKVIELVFTSTGNGFWMQLAESDN